MKRMERLIQAREQQRDVAADALSQARARLDQLARAQAALLQEQRDQFSGSVGTAALTPAQLESMDTAGRCARQATSCSEVEMQAAREAALQTQRSLRQLEILRSRARSEREQVLRRRERRELDEIASQAKRRLRALLPTLLLIVAAGTGAGCSEETPPAESEKTEKPAEAAKQERAEEPKCPDEVFTAEELLVLRKLRDRRRGLLAAEQKLATERAKLALTQRKTKEMLDQIESWQRRQTDPRPKPGRVNLVKVLKGMNMRSAAAMLAQMDPGTVAAALTRLEPAEVSRLLAKMPPESAAAVGARLSLRDRRPRADKVSGKQSDKPGDDKTPAQKTTKTAGGESETAAGPKAKAKARPKAARPKAARPKAARPKAARPKAAKLPAKLPAKAPRREAAAAAVKPAPAPAAAAPKAQPKKATTMETTPKAAPAVKAGAGLGPKKTTEKRER